VIEIPTLDTLYQAMAHVAARLLRREATVLIFLPGKGEIIQFRELLTKAEGVDDRWVVTLHADLEEDELRWARRVTKHPKAILSTSIAESALALPEVDHVLDSGRSRRLHAQMDVVTVRDHQSSESEGKQRECRAGRVKPGCSTRFESTETKRDERMDDVDMDTDWWNGRTL